MLTSLASGAKPFKLRCCQQQAGNRWKRRIERYQSHCRVQSRRGANLPIPAWRDPMHKSESRGRYPKLGPKVPLRCWWITTRGLHRLGLFLSDELVDAARCLKIALMPVVFLGPLPVGRQGVTRWSTAVSSAIIDQPAKELSNTSPQRIPAELQRISVIFLNW